MNICPNPECKQKTVEKIVNEDGSFYYYCKACRHKSITNYPNSKYLDWLIKPRIKSSKYEK